jgi:hypothetical protein
MSTGYGPPLDSTGTKFAHHFHLFFCSGQRTAEQMMLDALGNTPDDVAAFLHARGIKGIRNTVRNLNPIVRYAHSITTDTYSIDIIQGDKLRIIFASGQMTEVPVPKAVQEFLELFNRGRYADLELPTGTG